MAYGFAVMIFQEKLKKSLEGLFRFVLVKINETLPLVKISAGLAIEKLKRTHPQGFGQPYKSYFAKHRLFFFTAETLTLEELREGLLLSSSETWRNQRTTQLTISPLRPIRMGSRSQGNTDTLPPRGWIRSF
ncbi:PREDICTED: uncharacterized protein LOC104598803 [Nelumbo nucifera]|uniref:Uncharacterized protein LOC104598803 n=1 Tax=Nelumbo nucifera TaxID=4432 RepID=A0A1U7ZZM6_NELNU|nr:PREDICTED: uncharacterized protein LOC104598803 [Nelumbo nucifera]